MDLIVLDTDLNAVHILDTYESLIWTERYQEYGDFEIYTPMSDDIFTYIQNDYYLQCKDSDRLMIIEKILVNTDAEEGNYVTVTGRSLESILDRRIIWGLKTISGNLQTCIQTLLDECIISPTDSDRQIENFIFEESTDEAITELTIEAQYTGDNLYDVITAILQ